MAWCNHPQWDPIYGRRSPEGWPSCPTFLKGNLLMNCSRVTWLQNLAPPRVKVAGRIEWPTGICVDSCHIHTHIHIREFRWTLIWNWPSSACFNPLQLVYQMYVQKWKAQSKTNTEKSVYHWQMDWSLFQENLWMISFNNHVPIDPAISAFHRVVFRCREWSNRNSDSNFLWKWRNPYFDQTPTTDQARSVGVVSLKGQRIGYHRSSFTNVTALF